MNTQRPTLGEALLSRLEARLTRRPRIGFSPAFYARFGWEDPWLADSFGGDPLQQEESFQHLSGRPFYAHLAALGRKRWWRDRRQRARIERLSGLRTAQRVRYPGEDNTGLAFPSGILGRSLASVALAMHLPTPVGANESEVPANEYDEDVAWYRGRDFVPARVSRRPWHSVDHPRARIVRGGLPRQGASEPLLPTAMQWAGVRSTENARSRDPILRELAQVSALLSKSRRRKVVQILSESEHLPHQERVVLLRRALGSGSTARVVRLQVERGLKETPSAGLDHALTRRFSDERGLRPVLRNSPTVDWVLPRGSAQRDSLEPLPEFRGARRDQSPTVPRSTHQFLSRSPVQPIADRKDAGIPRRVRPIDVLVSRVESSENLSESREPVASSLVKVSPARFEPLSPISEVSFLSPAGEPVPPEAEDSIAAEATPERLRRRRVVQQEAREILESRIHKTPASTRGLPTRWALARLANSAENDLSDSTVPLISSLPLPIRREARREEGRAFAVDISRAQAEELGVRQFRDTRPEMSFLEEIQEQESVESEVATSAWHRTPESKEREVRKRPRWDRSELLVPPVSPDPSPKRQWPRPAPARPGWRPAADDTVRSTTDHAWFRTPGGVRLRSKGFRTPSGTWVPSESYRTPQVQRAFAGLRFEPVFPEATDSETASPTETRRPDVRISRRAGWVEPTSHSAESTVSGDFRQNLRLLSEGRESQQAPSWTERAVGGSRIRASSELIRYLVQASDPEEVIRLIVDRGQELSRESALAAPVVEVIKQIQGEANKMDEAPSEVRTGSERGTGRFSGESRPSRAVRRVQGFRPLRGSRASRQNGVGEDRIMKLAGKLRSLIHLAEDQNRRDEARKHARLSADEAPEVRPAGPTASGTEPSGADVQALIQEVVTAVGREMELRRERRQEDNHEPWW